jgi:hypothetical protein
MSVKLVVVPEKQHRFGWYVQYVSSNNEQRNLSGAVFAGDMAWVEKYFRRKFLRVAKELLEVSVWDEGMCIPEEKFLTLREQTDGTIVASTAIGDEFVCQENPNGTRTTFNTSLHSSDRPLIGMSTYVPPTYITAWQGSPSLDTYKEAFELLPTPRPLHEHGGSHSGFKARFYEVFPREK